MSEQDTNGADTSQLENPLDNGSLDLSTTVAVSDLDLDLEDLLTLESKNKELLRLIKTDLEEKILSKIKHAFNESKANHQNKKYQLHFSRDYITDKVGSSVRIAETAICEGWSVPKYENEYQNLLGLPHTEDDPADRIKLKKPSQECFNCLATNHKITECPIKHDQERIQMHRKNFASQSVAAHEQAQLFANRYTKEGQDAANRGCVPGKISDNLREALGLTKRQLPPYIYLMRELGYPLGWLKEAEVKKSGLNVVDGKEMDTTDEIESGEEAEYPEYDPDKIIDFDGFNQPVPEGMNDEWRDFGVMRYNETISKKKFLSKLKLANKKPKARSMKKMDSLQQQQTNEESGDEEITTEATTEEQDSELKQEPSQDENYGVVISETAGTPIVVNISGVDKVPEYEKFKSIDIGDFKPYEMLSNSTGNYMNIVKLTREHNKNN